MDDGPRRARRLRDARDLSGPPRHDAAGAGPDPGGGPRRDDEGDRHPLTTTVKGLSSELRVGPDNGLDHPCAVALDNVLTVPTSLLGRTVGYLTAEQEVQLARAVVLAYDLEVPLLE